MQTSCRRFSNRSPWPSATWNCTSSTGCRTASLRPQEFTLEARYPFTVDCAIRPWAAYLIPRCDGKTTARELLAFLKENELLAADESEEGFADFLRVLISGGFLEIDGFRLPAALKPSLA